MIIFTYCKNPGINLKGSLNNNVQIDYYKILIVMMYYNLHSIFIDLLFIQYNKIIVFHFHQQQKLKHLTLFSGQEGTYVNYLKTFYFITLRQVCSCYILYLILDFSQTTVLCTL